MQDAKLFEKLAKPDFSKSCGRWEAHRHTKLQSNSKQFDRNLVLIVEKRLVDFPSAAPPPLFRSPRAESRGAEEGGCGRHARCRLSELRQVAATLT